MQRRLVAILSADVVGYSRLMAEDEEATLRSLTAHRSGIAELVCEHRGRVVDAPGDNLLAEFPSALDAVQTAIAIQRRVATANAAVPAHRRMEYRVGVHLGDVMVEGDRIYGDGVNVAARLEGLAAPGSICISDPVHQQVESKLDVRCDDLGPRSMKNIAKPLRVFEIRLGTPSSPLSAQPGSDRRSPAPGGPSGPAVAVLPFANLSGNPEHDYLADGMTEDVITLLSRMPGFMVIARSSTFAYRGHSPDVRTVGSELGARYVVEGSVREVSGRVRITARLVETGSGGQRWSERYDRPRDDIFAVQDEIARAIAAELHPQLNWAESEWARQRPPADLDAWSLYQQAIVAWYFPGISIDGCERAIALLRRSIERDASYALALAMLGDLLAVKISQGWSIRPEAEREEALALGRRAMDLAPTDPLVLFHWGVVLTLSGEVDRGAAALERSVERDPNNAMAWNLLGLNRSLQGRDEEGIELIQRAIALSPMDPRASGYHYVIVLPLLGRGKLDEARSHARRSVDLHGGNANAWLLLAAVDVQLGALDEARDAVVRARAADPGISLDRFRSLVDSTVGRTNAELGHRLVEAVRTAGLDLE